MLPLMRLTTFLLISTLLMIPVATDVVANPVGDFFKKIGHSISHLGQSTPTPTPRKKARKTDQSEKKPAQTPFEESITPPATPVPTPVEIRVAAVAGPDPKGRRDVPYGVAVPNKPGFVTSPYAPTQGLVDVRAFPSSTEVLDPFTGKIFLTP
jgi:hypothetical protein